MSDMDQAVGAGGAPAGGGPVESQPGGFDIGDFTNVPDTDDDFPVLPAGQHTLTLTGGGPKESQAGNPGVGLQFSCVKGDVTYMVFYDIWKPKKPLPGFVVKRHRDVLGGLGLPLKLNFGSGEAFQAVVDGAVGRTLTVTTKIESSEEYGKQARIAKVVTEAGAAGPAAPAAPQAI